MCLVPAFSCSRGRPVDPSPLPPSQWSTSCIDPSEPDVDTTCLEYCRYSEDRFFPHPADWEVTSTNGLLESLGSGAVLVAVDGDTYRHLAGCKLDRRFEEVAGAPGVEGRFFASTRVLVRASEVPADCSEATHAVVSYAVQSAGQSHSMLATVIPVPCSEEAIQNERHGCAANMIPQIPGYADKVEEDWNETDEARILAARFGRLLDIYPMDPARVAPLFATFLANPPDPISCFIALEAKQQVEDPDGRPVEWTDPELEGCAAWPPFDVCYWETFRPARLEPDQCQESLPTPSKP